jgi:hypothetical protein
MFHAADIAERQSASLGPFTGFTEESFSSEHVTDPLIPSVKNHAPGERFSLWWRKLGALTDFSVKQEGLACLSRRTPGHGTAVVTSLEKNISHELTDLPSLFRILLLDSKFHMYTFESLPEDIRYLPSDVRDGDDRAFDFQGPAAQGRQGGVMIAKLKNDCFSKQIKDGNFCTKIPLNFWTISTPSATRILESVDVTRNLGESLVHNCRVAITN